MDRANPGEAVVLPEENKPDFLQVSTRLAAATGLLSMILAVAVLGLEQIVYPCIGLVRGVTPIVIEVGDSLTELNWLALLCVSYRFLIPIAYSLLLILSLSALMISAIRPVSRWPLQWLLPMLLSILMIAGLILLRMVPDLDQEIPAQFSPLYFICPSVLFVVSIALCFQRRSVEQDRLKIGETGVYSGFWTRLGAGLIDISILIPVMIWLTCVRGSSFSLAFWLIVALNFLYPIYHLFFNIVLGGSPGKLALGLRVTGVDGTRITWTQACLRSSVDLLLIAFLLVAETVALLAVGYEQYLAPMGTPRMDLLVEAYPSWYAHVSSVWDVWILCEVIVFFLNDRRRALHDYIAGTVVMKKQFIVKPRIPNAPSLTR